MLDNQKKILSEKYADTILKLEPFLLRFSGYNPQDTRLQVENYKLHCTPGTFSLTGCKLLLCLSPKEVGIFQGTENKLIALKLGFDSTYFGKPVSFFLKGRLESLIAVRENVYTLDLVLTSTSDTYKELFLHLSEIAGIYNKVYHTTLTQEQLTGIKEVPLTHTQIIKGNQNICYGKLNHISPRHFEVVIEQPGIELILDQKYKYIIIYNNRPINLIGTVVKNEGNTYITTIEFNMEYIHIMTIYMNRYQKQEDSPNDTEDSLEEL